MASEWSPAKHGVTAISVDADIDMRRRRFGTRCVLRDHLGFSPPLAEAFANLKVLLLAKDLGLVRIEVQSDFLEVVRAVKSGVILTPELGKS